MSFLTRFQPTLRNVARPSQLQARLFTSSPLYQKSASETAKETIDSVNKTIGQAGVKGIEKGQQASETLKSSVGMGSSEAKGKASEMAGEAKGKASEVAGQAKGQASEIAGEAKGKKEEVKSKM